MPATMGFASRSREFERVTVDDPSALDDMFRLEAAWKGEAGTAIASTVETLGFYRDLAESFARTGALSLTFLRIGGVRIAGHFALEDDRAYYLLKPGYDPTYSQFGPGHILIYEAAVDARRRGLQELDFSGQDMAWKRSWTSLARQQVALAIYRPNLRGITAHLARYRVRPTIGSIKRAMFG
jgi:CelD/BcsL family acetyltransferase involved in cellulose biosynthesis